jgi:hypothetical protein
LTWELFLFLFLEAVAAVVGDLRAASLHAIDYAHDDPGMLGEEVGRSVANIEKTGGALGGGRTISDSFKQASESKRRCQNGLS